MLSPGTSFGGQSEVRKRGEKMHFKYLREERWNPTFDWVKTSLECADKINSYHEDYPKYVEATDIVLRETVGGNKIDNWKLRKIHKSIFADKSFAGKWRDVDVRVGIHHPPQFFDVAELTDELYAVYNIFSIEDLIEWYKDFETIHPFQDGNGRVGGVIVASYAHNLHPERGWLAPNQ